MLAGYNESGGAIVNHLTLGVEINNDGGTLLYMAVDILTLSILILWNQRNNIPIIGSRN